MADPTQTNWGDPGQSGSPLAAALAALGLPPEAINGQGSTAPSTGVPYNATSQTYDAGWPYIPSQADPFKAWRPPVGGLGGLGGGSGPAAVPKDPLQEIDTWKKFRETAGQATQGINNMPFVFGGANTGGYDTLADMTPDQVFAKFYKGGTPPSAQGANPVPSPTGPQSNLLSAGGLPALLLGNSSLQPSQQQSNGLFGWGFLGL